MIPQCKGKDLNKVPRSKLGNKFYASIKYDGHYTQIHKSGGRVRFFTSGGKEFYHEPAAEEILLACKDTNCILEAEFIADTDGKLGSRGKAAKLTTYRTNFSKGIANIGLNTQTDKFKVFDVIVNDMIFEDRLRLLEQFDFKYQIEVVEYFGPYNLQECIEIAKGFVKRGYEGLYLKSTSHLQLAGKRVNNAIKLKIRPTADLLCIGTLEGEGKYAGKIGSLILVDAYGREVKVGSGLQDYEREIDPSYYIGKIVEIEYEQVLDTYIQPTFVRIRTDKKEID